MSIERGHASGVSSSATPRHGTARSAAAQAAAAGGDFLAMLAALAEGPAGGAPWPPAAGDAALADAGPGRKADRRADALGQEAALAATGDGAAAMAALMAAGLGGVAGALAGAEAVAAAASGALAQGDAAAGRAHASDGLLARAGGLQAPPEPPPPGPSAEATPAAATTAAPAVANPAAGAALPDAAALRAAAAGLQAEPNAAHASVFEQLKNRLAAQDAAGTSPAASRAQAVTQALRQSERMSDPRSSASALAEPAGVQAGAGDALTAAAGLARGARGGQQADAGGRTEGGWAAPEFTPTVQYDAGLGSVQAATPDAAGDGAPLAEQLRYWLSQGVTSAEWTVAGDADPVQVSLSLQGNEASIAFRSEQAGTRELLAGTVDQLRDLLQREGLVLAGVSVGAEGSGARGQPPGGDAGSTGSGLPRRPASAPVQAVAAVSAPAPGARSAGASVDLFV